MADPPRVILSGFADEAANQKTAVQQFAAFAALGLQHFSIRFIDVGGGVKNVMHLTRSEIRQVRRLQEEYGLSVSSIGSPMSPSSATWPARSRRPAAWPKPSRPS